MWCVAPYLFDRGDFGPCKALTPIVEEISNEMNDIDFGAMNIDNQPNTPTKFGIRGIPALILFRNGEVIDRMTGAMPKQSMDSWLDRHMSS